MDVLSAAELATEATKNWDTLPRDRVIHTKRTDTDYFFLQCSADWLWWQAIIIIGPRGGLQGEFITMNPREQILADRVTQVTVVGFGSAGPLQLPDVGRGKIAQKIRAVKSVMTQLLKRAENGEITPGLILKHRNDSIRTFGESSIRALQGGAMS